MTILKLITLITVLFAPMALHASGDFEFEFLDTVNQFDAFSEYPYGKPHLIVIKSQSSDVSTLLPITFEIYINSEGVTKGSIPDIPDDNCRSSQECAIEGKIIDDPGVYASLEIYAYDKDNQELARYIQPGLGYEGPVEDSWIPPRDVSQYDNTGTAQPKSSGALIISTIVIVGIIILGGLTFIALRKQAGKKTKKR